MFVIWPCGIQLQALLHLMPQSLHMHQCTYAARGSALCLFVVHLYVSMHECEHTLYCPWRGAPCYEHSDILVRVFISRECIRSGVPILGGEMEVPKLDSENMCRWCRRTFDDDVCVRRRDRGRECRDCTNYIRRRGKTLDFDGKAKRCIMAEELSRSAPYENWIDARK